MQNKKARAKARYLKMMERNQTAKKTRASDRTEVTYSIGRGSKPEHGKRALDIYAMFNEVWSAKLNPTPDTNPYTGV